MKKYLVGGAVRDFLLKQKPHDKDYVVVGSTPEEMLLLGYKQVGKEFPVFIHPETDDEYALARKEVSTGNRYTDFKFDFNPNVTLREDLERRDFTMNALALDDEGCIVDFFTGKKFIKTKNIQKLETLIQKKRIKQQNIKKDYFHKSTTALVKTKPSVMVLEDLNVAGMRKNKHLSHAIQSASISMFKDILVNKASVLGIEIVYADRFYPSSQICSHCGNRKPMKLSERVYKCPVCGVEIDRDFNASINLKHYREFPEKLSLWRAKPTEVA